jgi:hypothetical protein
MLTAECAALYEEVGRRFDEAKARQRPISAMSSDWLDVVDWNRKLFDGMQHFHLGKVDEEAMNIGNALSRFTYAANRTAEAVNACANASPALQEQFRRSHALCLEVHAEAKKSNDTVYFEKVPAIATLPKPERKRMVKPLTPPELEGIIDPVPPPPTPTPSREPSSTSLLGSGAAAPDDDASLVRELNRVLSAGGGGSEEPPPPSFADAEEAGLTELVTMGFDVERARKALSECGGSVQMATEKLLSEA